MKSRFKKTNFVTNLTALLMGSLACADQDQLLKILNQSLQENNLIPACKSLVSEYKKSKPADFKLDFQFDKKSDFCTFSLKPKAQVKVLLPKIYPFLEKKFTLASLDSLDDKKLLSELPLEIQNYIFEFNKVIAKNPTAYDDDLYAPHVFSGEKLKKKFPNFSKQSFFVLTKSNLIKTTLDSIEFSLVIPAGFYQVELKLKNQPEGALFAYAEGSLSADPKILNIGSLPSDLPIKPSSGLVIVPLGAENKYFIGTKNNSASSFEMIWDHQKKKWSHMTIVSSVSYGNESNDFIENLLIDINSEKYLLRNTERSSELYFLKDDTLTNKSIGDHRATEV